MWDNKIFTQNFQHTLHPMSFKKSLTDQTKQAYPQIEWESAVWGWKAEFKVSPVNWKLRGVIVPQKGQKISNPKQFYVPRVHKIGQY